MTDGVYVGVDLGTQSVKVCVADGQGTVLAETTRPLTSHRDGVRHEQAPAEWIAATSAALTDAIGQLTEQDRRRIAAVAMCGTSGTIAVVDADGRSTGPAIMYDDARAGDLVAEVAAADPERWRRLGYRIQPTWAITKIVDLTRRGLPPGSRFAHQPDVVAAAMTGGLVATDWSSALKSGYDLVELAWPVDAYRELGADAEILPDVVAPGIVLGETSAAWEQSTGLPAGTAVVAGMTDGCASQLGAGAINEGDWHTVIGTTLVLKGVSATLLRDDSGAIYSHRSPQEGRWLPGGASSVGARAVSTLLDGTDLAALEREAATLHAAPPTTYPLIGTGERFPFVRPDASGFVRLADAEDADLAALGRGPEAYLAILTGVAHVERLCFDTLAARGAPLSGRLSSSGGGTRSALWNQLRADTLAHPIALPESAEPSLGMAILAASAVVEEALGDLASRMTRITRTVEPDPAGVSRMAEGYEPFRDALAAKGWIR